MVIMALAIVNQVELERARQLCLAERIEAIARFSVNRTRISLFAGSCRTSRKTFFSLHFVLQPTHGSGLTTRASRQMGS